MATGTSFGTRKVLGRRYGTDPAMLLEYERLNNEMSLIPGREARAQQESQFTRGLDVQQSAGKQAGISGLVGTAGNLAVSGMMLNAYRGQPLISNPLGTSTVAGAQAGVTAAGGGSLAANQAANTTFLAGENAVGSTGMGMAGTGTMSAPAGGTLAGTYAAPAVAGYLGGQLGQPIGEAIGVGGERERGAVGGALAGAGAGAMWGGSVGGVPGAAVGAVIGSVVGLATGGKGTWICTATNKHVGTSKEQKASMKKLRRYAKENFPGWLEFYNQNGPTLIREIEDQEHDLVLFYNIVKRTLVEPCVLLIDRGDLKGAFDLYKKKTEELFNEYAPDIKVQEVL